MTNNRQPFYELNIDGLVGPSHHYAGLAKGNLASTQNALTIANPQAAARQGLAKMRLLQQMGLKQALFPPQQRPNLQLLKQLGFTGSPAEQIAKAHQHAPELLSACYSASSMWAANTATVSASTDTDDQRVHFTAANLISNLHRSQEADFSQQVLAKIFSCPQFFVHHPPLPKSATTADEGAANHSRLCAQYGSPAVNLFVYGRQALQQAKIKNPKKYPARQTLEASQVIARSHQLAPHKAIFAQQNPLAIDQGVFHNDVVAVANQNVLFIHEEALVEQSDVFKLLKKTANFPLTIIEVGKKQLSIKEAVSTYLFNSQLVNLANSPTSNMMLIAPSECAQYQRTNALINDIIADNTNPITAVHYVDLRQSMRNGGGPACLRLRVPLSQEELSAMHQGIIVNDALLDTLDAWIMRHYRAALHADDLVDPLFMNECLTALDELSKILQLGSIYPFQK